MKYKKRGKLTSGSKSTHDSWSAHSTVSGQFRRLTHRRPTDLFPVRAYEEARKTHAVSGESKDRSWGGDRNSIKSSTRKSDYFRYVDTRIRRLEARGMQTSRIALTGPRRALKDILDTLGSVSTVYPFIADDGDSGVFAEWRAGAERIEVAVDDEGSAYASVAVDGATTLYADFDSSLPMPFEVRQRLRSLLDRQTRLVRARNPSWLSLFIG